MQPVIFTILTDKKLRNTRGIELELDRQFTVGVPWFNKSHVDLPTIKIDIAS